MHPAFHFVTKGTSRLDAVDVGSLVVRNPIPRPPLHHHQDMRKAGATHTDQIRNNTMYGIQGQDKALVLGSIANQIEWLLSPNRWNVAIFHAHAYAIVIGDWEAHLNALPSAPNGIAAQEKMPELMEDGAWTAK